MPKKAKGKHRLDKYYHLAKEQGYRSRAAFKLIQLNKQFRFLHKSRSCLDLCAAPVKLTGGWMQVAAKEMPMNSLIVGIDLVPIKPVRGCRSIVGDITTSKARAAIKKETNNTQLDVVLHDGAPNVGGAWASEAYTQSALVLEALKLATDTLVPKGTFVTKVFRSQDYNALMFAFKQLFSKVEATKPAASRNASAEIFVVCQGYKAPEKIDPRLLDVKHLFKQVSELPKIMGPDALLKQKMKQKRFREGYEEGVSLIYKETSIADFVLSETPMELLGQFNRFTLLDKTNQVYSDISDLKFKEIVSEIKCHPSFNKEIQTLMNDLQVLGRSEFKLLLKWRMLMRKNLNLNITKERAADVVPGETLDDDESMIVEMQNLMEKSTKLLKRDRKKRLENKRKSRIRAAQLAMGEGIVSQDEAALFSLSSIKGGVRAEDINEDTDNLEYNVLSDSSEELLDLSEDVDSDDERMKYEADQEEALERAYLGFLERQGRKEELVAEKKVKLMKKGDLFNDSKVTDLQISNLNVNDDVEEFNNANIGGGLYVDSDPALKANDWYNQDLFSDYNSLMHSENKTKFQDDGFGMDSSSDDDNDKLEDKKGFETVPMSESESSSDDESLNPHEAAEIRAYAKAMLRGRSKNDILENGYHRYAFHDTNLPKWFTDDELRHMRPPEVVTKEDIEAEKQRIKDVTARPIKKIVEAKARKKRRLQVRLEQAKNKANSIIEQSEMSERAKSKEIASIYAKAKASSKSKKKPSRNDKFKRKGPPLDRRLISDKRERNSKTKKRLKSGRKRH